MHLEPLYMYMYEQKGMIEELEAANIMDCMECGACAYICPGRLHLTQTFKTGKQKVKDAAAKRKAAAEAAAAQKVNTLSPTSIIFYDYSMSKLTPKEKTRLELMADLIKSGPKDRVYKIEGHADQQTGTAAGNKRVAENRAKSVYDFLVKCGVNPKQLTYEGKGNAANVYENNQKANRAVIIK